MDQLLSKLDVLLHRIVPIRWDRCHPMWLCDRADRYWKSDRYQSSF